jgi:nucleotide-binding universal stress UspA family protein
MNNQSPKHILCAVRGQPHSRETATRAIHLALEYGARLTFFLVLDAEFMGKAAPTMVPIQGVIRQLHDLGEFAMLILCDQAQRRGVEQVDYLIRTGNVPKQLLQIATESHAEMMVLGRPKHSAGKSVFAPGEFDCFVEKLEKDANIRVVQVAHENQM